MLLLYYFIRVSLTEVLYSQPNVLYSQPNYVFYCFTTLLLNSPPDRWTRLRYRFILCIAVLLYSITSRDDTLVGQIAPSIGSVKHFMYKDNNRHALTTE
jgi:hypothetical protein